jgi:hypothetical protein
MKAITNELREQQTEAAKLDAAIAGSLELNAVFCMLALSFDRI